MKNVLLIGIRGVYNYGCEAIIRGTVTVLHRYDPEIKIYYASYNYADDSARLEGCDIKLVKRTKQKRFSYANLKRKFLSYLHIDSHVRYDSTNWLEKFDTVFSIGGDMYTLFSNGGYDRSLPLFCEECQVLGIKYVLWGASIGPFEKNREAFDFYKKHLSKVDLIVCREPVTVNYLKKIGVTDNVVLAPDPAFFIAPEKCKPSFPFNRQVIGINLSPLSSLYHYADLRQALYAQAEIVVSLIKTGKKIVLIPHVLSPDRNDNDLWYLTELYRAIPQKYKREIRIVNSDPGFIKLKNVLITCDLIIAVRMHCAINAIACGVPALFLSYSAKAKGMAAYIYDSPDNVIDLVQFENLSLLKHAIEENNYRSKLEQIRAFDFALVFDRIN